jgi:Dolichyl-phosphate-mannose-protein mannosyltransferase
VLALALALATGLVATHPVPGWFTHADEGCYLRYAARIARDGPQALPALAHEHLEDPLSRATEPPPLRLAVVLPDALAVRVLGADYPSLQRVSLAAFLALLIIAFLGFRRVAGDGVAMGVTLLLAVSPLQLGMARRTLGDNLNTTLWTASILLCTEALANEWRRGWLLVGLIFSATMLVKEANLILIPIALALVTIDVVRRRRPPSPYTLAGTTLLPLALATVVTVLAAGDAGTAIENVRATFTQVAGNAYAIRFGKGPWYRYVVDFLLLSPWTTLLYVTWLGMLATTRRTDPRLLSWALLPILYLAALSPTARFVRWAMPLDVPIRLGTVLSIAGLLRGRATLAHVAVLGVLMLVDVRSFLSLFVTADIYDPSSVLLLWWRGFLPP